MCVSVCVCRVGSGYALLKSHPRCDTRRMSSSAASTAATASPRLHSEPYSEPALAVVCTCWPALASLGWNMENLSQLITHTSAATLWTLRLAARDTCHMPHTAYQLPYDCPPSWLPIWLGVNLSNDRVHLPSLQILEPINNLLDTVDFDAVFYSLDWHPSDHVSFIDNVKMRPMDESSAVSGQKEETFAETLSKCQFFMGYFDKGNRSDIYK